MVGESVPDTALAQELGVLALTVHAARWRLRKDGWTSKRK